MLYIIFGVLAILALILLVNKDSKFPILNVVHEDGVISELEVEAMGILNGLGVERSQFGSSLLKIKKQGKDLLMERICKQQSVFLSQGFSEVFWPQMENISLGFYLIKNYNSSNPEVLFSKTKYVLGEGRVLSKESLPFIKIKIKA